jgi:glycosyltransferase involved in cell wall biosynthesis
MIKVMHVWKDVKLYHGIHEQLQSLARYIDKGQFETSVCIFGKRHEEIGRQFEDLKVAVHYLNAESLQNPFLIVKLLKLFRAVRPDIVQTYCLNPNVFGGIAARWATVPVIIAGELTRNDQAPSGLQRFRDKLLKPLNDIISNQANCRVFISEALQQHWSGRKLSKKHRVIYPAFSQQKLIESTGKKSDNCHVVGIIARLSEEKRHIDLLHAMKAIIKVVPDARLRIVGEGPLAQELRTKAAELGVRDSVDFTGYSPNSFNELKKIAVFVLPSRSEGFGICILEAMASGIPVVATGVGGIPEQILDGETGILISPYQPEQIAKAVISLLQNPQMAREMGKRAKARAEARFNYVRFVRSHEDLYRELMQS